MGLHDGVLVVSAKGIVAGEDMEQQHAHGVDIGPWSGVLALQLLGSGGLGGAEKGDFLLGSGIDRGQPGQGEIQDFDHAAIALVVTTAPIG